MLGKAAPDDFALEKAWLRMWGRHSLIFLVYLLLFLFLYFRLRHRVADADLFFWEQRVLSRKLLLSMGIHLAGMLFLHSKLWLYRWRQFFYAPASPYNLALVRIIFFWMMLMHCLFVARQQWLPIASLPSSARQSLPGIGWLIDILPISPTLYSTAIVLTIAFATLATLGLFTRPAMIALVPLIFYVYGVPQFFGKMSHYQFFVWITILLAASPCYEVWSLDGIWRRLRGFRADRQPHFAYGLALRWIMLSLASIYFFSGVHKLYDSGLFWALSDNPVNLLRTEWLEQFRNVPFLRVDRWPILCSVAASAVILFELSYPFVLISRRGKWLLAVEAILFHNLNGYFLKIDFAYLKAAHLSYFDLGAVRLWLLQRRRWVAWLCIVTFILVLGWYTATFFLLPYILLGAIIDLSWRAIPLQKRGRWILAMRKRLTPLRAEASVGEPKQQWLRWSYRIGATLVIINAFYGAFGIHSWPFSAYPSYSFVRAEHVQYGWFLPKTPSGQALDLDAEAQAADFRKEDILPMAERIVVAWKYNPDQLSSAVLACWQRWQTELPRLQQAASARVVIRTYSLDPDRYDEFPNETPLGDLKMQGSQWIFAPMLIDTMLQR